MNSIVAGIAVMIGLVLATAFYSCGKVGEACVNANKCWEGNSFSCIECKK